MADETTPQGTTAPAASSAAIPTDPKAAAAALLGYDPDNPPWLKGRLEGAQKAALEGLGVTDPAKAKELLAAAAKAEEDAKTAAQKLGETSTALSSAKAELARQQAVTAEHAARMMIGLTAEQQAAVKAIAGEDAATQLRTITALTPTWAAAGTPAGGALPPAPPKAPATPPGGTAPPAAPPPGDPSSPPDHAAIHAELLKTNPFAAAQYGLAHAADVWKITS
jgi:hypothetical protein